MICPRSTACAVARSPEIAALRDGSDGVVAMKVTAAIAQRRTRIPTQGGGRSESVIDTFSTYVTLPKAVG